MNEREKELYFDSETKKLKDIIKYLDSKNKILEDYLKTFKCKIESSISKNIMNGDDDTLITMTRIEMPPLVFASRCEKSILQRLNAIIGG